MNSLDIKKRRAELNLSQEELAAKIGVSRNTIINYEKGGIIPESKKGILYQILFSESNNLSSNARSIDNPFIYVPLVPVRVRAGYLSGYGDPEYISEMPTFPVITDNTFHGKYRCFEVEGDSMDDGSYDCIWDGDIILCREIKQDLWQYKLHINKWKYFVIVHKEGIAIKQIIEHDIETSTIKCHSLNPVYDDFDISLNNVYELYNVIKIVDRTIR